VELHLDLWDSDREGAPLKLPGDLLARSTTRAWGAASFNALGDEDAFLFEAVHAFRHVVHNWCRLSTLYEISYFLNGRRSDRDFWHRFCARIENNLPLRHVAGVVFNLASSLFKVPDPLTNVPSRLFDLTPQLQLWIDHHGMGSAIDNFSGNKLSLLLLREFVADPARWSEIRGRRLFPLQMPHRLQIPAPKRGHPFLREVCLYGSGVARRFWFHARAAAQYALESVRWHVSLRRGFGHTPPREPKAPSGESERPQARRHALRLSSRKHFYPTRDPGAN